MRKPRRPTNVIIHPGDTLPTCSQGHTTCFPRNCPVCRAMATPYVGKDGSITKPLIQMGNRVWRSAA